MNAAFPDFPDLTRKTQTNLRNFLERDMDDIQKMGIRFRAQTLDIKIISFIEQKPTHPSDCRVSSSTSLPFSLLFWLVSRLMKTPLVGG